MTQSDLKAAQNAVDAYEAILNSGSTIQTIRGYGKLSSNYDKISLDCEYNKNPQHGAFLCGKYVNNSKHSVVLDIGAGTGALGYHLRTVEKFQGHIDILDGSIEMLYQASQKGAGFRAIVQLLIDGEIPLSRNYYDVVTCVGALVPNHIPASALPEFLELVKPGGYLIFNDEKTAGDEYFKELHRIAERLQAQSVMELVETTSNPQTCLKDGGTFHFHTFRKCC